MKKLLSVFVGLLCSVAVFAQTDFSRVVFRGSLQEGKNWKISLYSWIVTPLGVARVK